MISILLQFFIRRNENGADSIRKRLEEYGVHVTVEVGDGMYHSYAMMPLVEEAQEGYRHFMDYIKS